jgi:hypothetical protein
MRPTIDRDLTSFEGRLADLSLVGRVTRQRADKNQLCHQVAYLQQRDTTGLHPALSGLGTNSIEDFYPQATPVRGSNCVWRRNPRLLFHASSSRRSC